MWYEGSLMATCMLSLSVVSNSLQPHRLSLPGSSVHGISQLEYWSGLPFHPPGDLPDPGIEPASPVSPLQVYSTHWAIRGAQSSVWTLICVMWNLIPWSGIEPGPLALGAWSLSHWTTREVPLLPLLKASQCNCKNYLWKKIEQKTSGRPAWLMWQDPSVLWKRHMFLGLLNSPLWIPLQSPPLPEKVQV